MIGRSLAQAATLFFDDIKAQERDFHEIPERTILLQDRWAESTYVYQGLVAAAKDDEVRDKIYKQARQMTAPDLTVCAAVVAMVAAARIQKRDGKTSDISHLAKIVAAYDQIYRDGAGIWGQPVYPTGPSFNDNVETVSNLAIAFWKEKYGSQ